MARCVRAAATGRRAHGDGYVRPSTDRGWPRRTCGNWQLASQRPPCETRARDFSVGVLWLTGRAFVAARTQPWTLCTKRNSLVRVPMLPVAAV